MNMFNLGGSCREASIAHFQGSKRNYFHFTARIPPPNSNTLLITEFGFIPFIIVDPFPSSSSSSSLPPTRHASLPSHGEVYGDDLYAGRLGVGPIEEFVLFPSLSASNRQKEKKLIRERENGFKKNTISSQELARTRLTASSTLLRSTKYCGSFSKDLKKCLCLLYMSEIVVLLVGKATSARVRKEAGRRQYGVGNLRSKGSKGSSFKRNKSPGITLIVAAWAEDFDAGYVNPLLIAWKGPKVTLPPSCQDLT